MPNNQIFIGLNSRSSRSKPKSERMRFGTIFGCQRVGKSNLRRLEANSILIVMVKMVNGKHIFNVHWPNSAGLIEGFCTVCEQPWVDLNPRPFALKPTSLTTAPRRPHTVTLWLWREGILWLPHNSESDRKFPDCLISSGVAQGLMLGALQFKIFFPDLPNSVSSTCAHVADATLLYDATWKRHRLSPRNSRGNPYLKPRPVFEFWSRQLCGIIEATPIALRCSALGCMCACPKKWHTHATHKHRHIQTQKNTHTYKHTQTLTYTHTNTHTNIYDLRR